MATIATAACRELVECVIVDPRVQFGRKFVMRGSTQTPFQTALA
ncbi:hypothetical protein RBSH_01044 [Rhodopirellula baltica SH28]|uniref:Uncharacterized protein n=1 Tax=Rhodopirellula baltica SH28 TaxID=993517 RepID=K5CHT0_RHOBT|nr:hypothetical protein RBSH_01044 [Rhodopirellula baltica SH28]